MRFLRPWLITIAIAQLAGCAPPADSPGEAADASGGKYTGASLNNWTRRCDEMTTALELDESEQAKLKSAFETGVASLRDWYARHGSELAGLESKMFEAGRQKNLAEFRKYKSLAEPLKNEIRMMHDRYDRSVENALTDENRWAWLGHKNARRILKHTESLQLTEIQVEQLEQVAIQAVVEQNGNISPESAGYAKLIPRFRSLVLTGPQKQDFDDLLKRKPLLFVFGDY